MHHLSAERAHHRRVYLIARLIASCHLPRSASLTPPMAFRTLPLTWSPLPSLWSLRSPVSFPPTSFTLPFACSAEPLILSLSTMVRLLCCSDNVRKRKKLPGAGRDDDREARLDRRPNAIEYRLAGPLFHAKELVELVDFRPDLFLEL